MAEASSSLLGVVNQAAPSRSLHAAARLRLIAGSLIVLGSIITLVGISWDIQWHDFVGRDRTLIPPHQMMLGGILLSGLVALAMVMTETIWARRSPELTKQSTSFAGLFTSSLGAYITGFAALDAAIGFPLDAYWHALYGIDTNIWAPFHVMILFGAALMPLGAVYLLNSVAHFAELQGNRGLLRTARIGMVFAFATILGLFTYLLEDAPSKLGYINVGLFVINVFPLLSGLVVSWFLIAGKFVLPWRWGATSIALAYIGFALIFELFVPYATNGLVAAEHLSYRRPDNEMLNFSEVALGWFLAPVLAALLIDLLFRRFRSRDRSPLLFMAMMVLAAFPACFPLVPIDILVGRPMFIRQIIGHLYDLSAVPVLSIALTLVAGLTATAVGVWLGQRLGQSIDSLERGA